MMNYDDNDKTLWAKNGKILEKIEKVLVIWKAAFLQSLKLTVANPPKTSKNTKFEPNNTLGKYNATSLNKWQYVFTILAQQF